MQNFGLNTELKERFLSLIKNGRVSHSYIVIGGEGAGKLDFALFCAKAIFCEGEPCGKCENCRKADSDVHPDVVVINRGESSSFKIEQVRRVTESINIPPNEAKKKIYILDHCENMTVQAQNALLKAFEEPPEYVVFFILAEKKEALLPTVLSRATVFNVSAMDKEELFSLLKKRYPKETEEKISDAVRLSEGFYGRAVRYLEKGFAEERKTALALSESFLGKKSVYEAARILNAYKAKRDAAERVLFLTLYAVRDTLLYKNGGNELCFLNEADVEKYSSNSAMMLVKLSDKIIEAVESLVANGNFTSCVAKLCSGFDK